MEDQHKTLVNELVKLLKGGSAHAGFKDSIKDLSAEVRGVKPDQLPYSIWQLVEHIRIAQWDMVQFSKEAKHKSPSWPDEYWVKDMAPKDQKEWDKSIKQIDDDLEEFIELLKKEDIYKPIAHGDGQNILREALQIADHTSYHTAEIIVIRRLLSDWK